MTGRDKNVAIAANGEMADRSQSFGHYGGMKAGRQDQPIGFIGPSGRDDGHGDSHSKGGGNQFFHLFPQGPARRS